jgi:hypothetical protein
LSTLVGARSGFAAPAEFETLRPAKQTEFEPLHQFHSPWGSMNLWSASGSTAVASAARALRVKAWVQATARTDCAIPALSAEGSTLTADRRPGNDRDFGHSAHYHCRSSDELRET